MTTKVKDNQLRETYIPISTPHIKSLGTTADNIFFVDDGIGNITVHVGEIVLPPSSLFSGSIVAGDDSAFSGYSTGDGSSIGTTVGTIAPSNTLIHSGVSYTIDVLGTLYGGGPFSIKNFRIEVTSPTGLPSMSPTAITDITIGAKVYTVASSDITSTGTNSSGDNYLLIEWEDGGGTYDNTTDLLVSGETYTIVIE